MDTQCIPQTTKVGLDLDFVSTTKTEQSGIPGIFFSIRGGRSTATAPAAVVGKPKWWVVSGRARVRILTTLTRWFDFLKILYPDLWREKSNLTNTFRAPDFLGKMIQFDEHTFQVG